MHRDDLHFDSTLIGTLNGLGAAVALGMLAISLWLSTDVPLATKGFWAVSVLMFGLALINFVRWRFDARQRLDRIARIEEARNERILEDHLSRDD